MIKHIAQRLGLAALVLAAVACGGNNSSSSASSSSPSAPSSTSGPALDPTCPPSANAPSCAPANTLTIQLHIITSGAWSYSIGSLTVSGNGAGEWDRIVGISPGTLQVSGQMIGNNVGFIIGIPATNAGGSIPQSSLQTISGPTSGVSISGTTCSVSYARPQAQGSAPIPFSFSFTLNAAGAPFDASCH